MIALGKLRDVLESSLSAALLVPEERASIVLAAYQQALNVLEANLTEFHGQGNHFTKDTDSPRLGGRRLSISPAAADDDLNFYGFKENEITVASSRAPGPSTGKTITPLGTHFVQKNVVSRLRPFSAATSPTGTDREWEPAPTGNRHVRSVNKLKRLASDKSKNTRQTKSPRIHGRTLAQNNERMELVEVIESARSKILMVAPSSLDAVLQAFSVAFETMRCHIDPDLHNSMAALDIPAARPILEHGDVPNNIDQKN